MSQKKIYIYSSLIIVVLIAWFFSDAPNKQDESYKQKTKISLRAVGNDLLLANQDTTSLVLPIVALKSTKYRLSFQQQLSISPDSLVNLIKKYFKKSDLPKYYRVEVFQCSNREVAYSYEMKKAKKNSIIPCGSRTLPLNCYYLEITFIKKMPTLINKKTLQYLGFLLIFIFLLDFFFHKKKQNSISLQKENKGKFESIGSFHFYMEQNKLVKEAIEINLSKKECELLAIFVAQPNEIIKREVLTKKVWEDHGVFVGRSLDTYISKLRKKLKSDDSVQLINVHGVGYKLEVK